MLMRFSSLWIFDMIMYDCFISLSFSFYEKERSLLGSGSIGSSKNSIMMKNEE